WRGELFRQILPASATAQNPQNAFEHLAVGGPRPSAASPRTWTRKQGPDLLPLGVGQQTTVSRHRPSIGAAVLVYLAFPSTQLPQNSGFAPSFETASSFSSLLFPSACHPGRSEGSASLFKLLFSPLATRHSPPCSSAF